jgi:UTP--glucose-1-phosphate uridylyltransferase
MNVSTCVIPIAGLGTRWLPYSKYIPKEMLSLNTHPVIKYVLDEVSESGFNKIIFVTSPKKKILNEYLREQNKSSYRSIEFQFMYQNDPQGLAHAILQAHPVISEEFIGVIMPDMPAVYSSSPPLKQLVDSVKSEQRPFGAISVAEYPNNNLLAYGECLIEEVSSEIYKVIHFCPRQHEGVSHHPGNILRIAGRLLLSTQIFQVIKDEMKEGNTVEINDTFIMQRAINEGKDIFAKKVEGKIFDTGTPQNYSVTNAFFAQLEQS